MPTPLLEVARRADEFFLGESNVHKALARMARTLSEMGIPYAIAGAMAVNAHGHRRETEDVDVLMTREGLAAFKREWLGRGWVERFPGSKGLRDAVCNVKVDVLLAGEYPGDGKPKPVVFPDPAVAVPGSDGLPVLPLRTLLELKIASGMTAAHRMHDLRDAMCLIRANGLPKDYAIEPYVAEKYRELWGYAQIDEDY